MTYQRETQCIHGGKRDGEENPYGSVSTPIFQTATFSHPGIGETTGHNYTRESNPTREQLEHQISVLEGACDTIACTTGMAAISVCLEIFKNGDHLICTEDLYGGSVRIFSMLGEQKGIQFSYVDTSDAGAVEAAVRQNTKALYIETPSNPTMLVTDLFQMKKIAQKHGLYLIVDNTFLSPYLQNPLKLGADIVVHSGTKYLCGHNDTLAGFLSTNDPKLAEHFRLLHKTMGCCLAPFDSFLLLRGIKTLAIRMERQEENALKIADFLKNHEKIKQVYYVGLPEHPGYTVNKRQARGSGGMLSFRTDTPQTARRILERVRLIAFAESLGGVESLITYPMYQTHGAVPLETRERLGITEDFLRLSVGIENADDLIGDLRQALA